jgi:hypothetical protein
MQPRESADNAARYHFADFTRENYTRLLRLAKQSYTFSRFADFERPARFVLWRHDVDFSPQSALKLAEREHAEGVVATYFVSLRSDFYNLLEPEVTACVRRILALDHDLALHFDLAAAGKDAEREAEAERQVLERVFACPCNAVSFHNPTVLGVTPDAAQFAGMINAASRYFFTEVGFCSDSNGYWRHRRLEDVLTAAADERLQVLTHPEMWQDAVMSPRERVLRCIDGRAARTRERYEQLLARHGREIVDW